MLQNINATKKGLITGCLMIVLALFFFYIFKQPLNSAYQYFMYVIYTIGIIWSLIDFQKKTSSTAKFKEYFSAGFKTFIVCTLLMVIYTGIFFYFNPAIIEEKIALNNELLIKQGNHMLAEIEANGRQMKRIFIPMMMGITTFMYLFLGALITAVIAGLFIQKKKRS